MKSHFPDKYQCQICMISLTRSDNLKRHIKLKHGIREGSLISPFMRLEHKHFLAKSEPAYLTQNSIRYAREIRTTESDKKFRKKRRNKNTCARADANRVLGYIYTQRSYRTSKRYARQTDIGQRGSRTRDCRVKRPRCLHIP